MAKRNDREREERHKLEERRSNERREDRCSMERMTMITITGYVLNIINSEVDMDHFDSNSNLGVQWTILNLSFIRHSNLSYCQ